jgi:hypothetical protein
MQKTHKINSAIITTMDLQKEEQRLWGYSEYCIICNSFLKLGQIFTQAVKRNVTLFALFMVKNILR